MKRKSILLILAALVALTITTGCGTIKIAGNPIGGAPEPTSPPTRTPRPTFTPRPNVTDTPAPTNTSAATNTPVPTQAPTQVAVAATATRRPATAVPPTRPPATAAPQPTKPPAPTVSPYRYGSFGVKCEHSGGTYLEIYVYKDFRDPNSLESGVRVRASWAPDGGPIGDKDEVTDDYGKAQFTLAGDGQPVKKGTWYAWIVDSKGTRISDMSPAVNTTGGEPDAPGTCWKAKFFFAGK